jgi:hypothetical protein
MKLIEQISADIMSAYKTKNKVVKELLGVVKGAATKVNKEPEDDEVIATIKSMIKTHNKSMSGENHSPVPTLTDEELEILNRYLPKQLSESEIRERVQQVIVNTGSDNMGFIMGMFNKTYGQESDFDNTLVRDVIKGEL